MRSNCSRSFVSDTNPAIPAKLGARGSRLCETQLDARGSPQYSIRPFQEATGGTELSSLRKILDRSVEWFLGLIYDVGRSLIFGNFMSVDFGSAWEGALVSILGSLLARKTLIYDLYKRWFLIRPGFFLNISFPLFAGHAVCVVYQHYPHQ